MNITEQAIKRVESANTFADIDTLGSASLLTAVKGLIKPGEFSQIVDSIKRQRRVILDNKGRSVIGSAREAWKNEGIKFAQNNPQADEKTLRRKASLFAVSILVFGHESLDTIEEAFLEGAYSVDESWKK